MPLREYECAACGHRFEVIQKMSDAPLETCPKCGGAVRKLQAAPAFQFKGSGWYVTDYARKGQPGAAKTEGESKDGTAGESKEAAKTGDKSEKKSETKTETKADTAKPAQSSSTSSTGKTPTKS